MPKITIKNKIIDESSACYIIAEMSANHNGDIEQAIQILHAAKLAGADAIKLQTYTADTITLDSKKEDFILPTDNPWEKHKTLYSLYEKAFTPWEWHAVLFSEAEKIGLDIFSSPFDSTAVDFLETLNCPLYKIASPEITDIPLIKCVAKTGKPVILSTGLANKSDIELAVNTLIVNGCKEYAILKCTTAYPAPFEDINLKTIPDMKKEFNCIVGLSDHSLGNVVPIASVSLGAKIIEKHFVLSKNSSSVDAFFSLSPSEFKSMVDDVKIVEKALGSVNYNVSPASEKNNLAKRSIYVSCKISKGELFTTDNIKSVRPSYGLHPKYYESMIGKVCNCDLEHGDRLKQEYAD
jgi:pseudaminic acid synthase